MKRIAWLLIGIAFGFAPALHAQDHGQIGVFGDYYNFRPVHTNFGGLGARVSATAWRYIHFEVEGAYDFDQVFSESFTNNTTGVVAINRSGLRIMRFDFGPKFETPGPMKFFVTVKGGVDDFMYDARPATFATFTDSAAELRADNVDGALYAGGGFEGFIGPIGVRLDVGDDIYFTGNTHGNNNLRIAFGPQFRF